MEEDTRPGSGHMVSAGVCHWERTQSKASRGSRRMAGASGENWVPPSKSSLTIEPHGMCWVRHVRGRLPERLSRDLVPANVTGGRSRGHRLTETNINANCQRQRVVHRNAVSVEFRQGRETPGKSQFPRPALAPARGQPHRLAFLRIVVPEPSCELFSVYPISSVMVAHFFFFLLIQESLFKHAQDQIWEKTSE